MVTYIFEMTLYELVIFFFSNFDYVSQVQIGIANRVQNVESRSNNMTFSVESSSSHSVSGKSQKDISDIGITITITHRIIQHRMSNKKFII